MIKNVYSGAKWEKQVAYCRAKRMGQAVAVSGTTAVDEHGSVVSPGDAYGQAKFIFRTIENALGQAGASLSDVIRTRMFITDMANFDAVARAHYENFQGLDPATSCVVVAALVDAALLVEIEADAVISG